MKKFQGINFFRAGLFVLLCGCDTSRVDMFDSGEPHRTDLQQESNSESVAIPDKTSYQMGAETSAARAAEKKDSFYRDDFPACLASEKLHNLHPIDAYGTVWANRPLSCSLERPEEAEGAVASRLIVGDDGCYATFLDLYRQSPARAAAFWVFSLTQDSSGVLGRPDSVVVKRNAKTGDKFLDGQMNGGIFTLTSPTWDGSYTIKLTTGREITELVKRMMYPVASKKCLAERLVRSGLSLDDHDLQTLPEFVAPLAVGLFGATSHTEAGSDAIFRRGISLMHTAPGRHPTRHLAPVSATEMEKTMQEAWLEGRARALFQMPFISDNGTAPGDQEIWVHGDLHRGNMLIDVDTHRVYLLDFEKMFRAKHWLGLGHNDDPTHIYGQNAQDLPPAGLHIGDVDRHADGCIAALAAWLDDPATALDLRADHPLWLADQARFVAFFRGYMAYTPNFAQPAVAASFEAACRRIVGQAS